MGIRQNIQKSRLVDCGGLQRHLSERGQKSLTFFAPRLNFSARFTPYLGRQLDFFKNSFSGGCLGTIPGGDTHFQAPGVTGGCFIREKPRKISFFASFEALPSTATHPNLCQISIFLAHIDGHSMGIHHNFQWGRLANCGRS